METPPPLPSEEPPKSPSPPLPPPSIQASNHDHERLDFETDAGGKLTALDGGPPTKRQRLDSQPEAVNSVEDEGPDSLLGSGLAAELLEEGEIFDSESILSRNGSTKSSSQCVDRDGSQATDSPLVVAGDDSYSNTDMDDASSKKFPVETNPGMSAFDDGDHLTSNIEMKNDDEQQELIDNVINTSVPEESKECSLKPAIPSHGQDEFEVIDDLESDGGGDQNCGGHDSDDESDDVVYDEDEIDALLDEEMDKNAPREKDSEKGHVAGAVLEQKEKVLLVDRCTDPFDILPENWVMVTHNSGMPVYLHKKTRVCTLSKPYFLGPSSARKHDIPISAIPCLQYRRALEKEAADSAGCQSEDSSSVVEDQQQSNVTSENGTTSDATTVQGDDSQSCEQSKTGLPKLGVRVETAKDHEKQNSLGFMEVREYCEKLFQFKTITVKRFKTWKDRRKHTSLLKKVARPSLPSSTKLIRCAIPADKDGKGAKRKEFVLNPAGKSDICILHEYVQQALRVQPRYIFEELQNSQTPFGATVLIGGEKYGSGFSSSKKGAKLEAAKQTLAILIPEMNKLKEEEKDDASKSDLSLFDTIKIEDPRVTELCIKAGQPGPFQVLCECLKRNYGVGDTQVQMEMKALKHQKSEFIMKVGKHEASVVCKNKREGKQQAAQAILQKMHPHIHTWGSLLRLYDRSTITQGEDSKASGLSDESAENIQCYMRAVVCYGVDVGFREETGTKFVMTNAESQSDVNVAEVCTQTDNEAGSSTGSTRSIQECTLNSKMNDDVLYKGTAAGSGESHSDVISDSHTKTTNINLCHHAVQTQWYGRDMYHKTTQYPEVHYSQDVEDRPDAVTVVSPKVPRASHQYSANYKCAEVRSASGVIYGFCPKVQSPGQPDPLHTPNLHSSQPEALQPSTLTQNTSLTSEAGLAAPAVTNTRNIIPSLRVSPVVLPGVFTPAVYPVGFQYPTSVCTPPNYMMTYPCLPQPLPVQVNTSQTSPDMATTPTRIT